MAVALKVEEIAWHSLAEGEVLQLIGLQSLEQGLTSSEASKRLAQYGRNALTPPKKPGFLYKLWVQVRDAIW